MVRQTAMRMAEVVTQFSPQRTAYAGRLPDENPRRDPSGRHRTPHRGVAEHCGRSVAVACLGGPEPDRMLATDVFPCEDGHAQERSLLLQVLTTVEARDLWIADRNFCTTGFLFGIANQDAAFVIRQHKQNLTCELLAERHKIGRCPRGMIYEQQMQITDEAGKSRTIRRVTIELKESTRDGETEIHVLTNLPKTVANARSVADLYLHRWTVERAFHELDQAFNGEIKTLGYPGAALLSFCVALLAYNVTSAVNSTLVATHGDKAKRETLSGYYLAGEVAATYNGMMIAIPQAEWTTHFALLDPANLPNPEGSRRECSS